MTFTPRFRPDPKPVPKPKIKKGLKKKRPQPTGEAAVFQVLWDDRPHVCFVTDRPLGDVMKVDFFFHILPKSLYPKYRLRPENIIFTTPAVHYKWHNGNKNSPEFKEVNKLYDKLKQQYRKL